MQVAGFVLTGGQSTRMRQDKALLSVGGQTLCEHIGDIVGVVAEEIFLVGHPERYAGLKYPCLPDLHPDHGPLSGLETVLCRGQAEFNIVTGCDSYNLNAEWLRVMLRHSEQGAQCVVAEDAAGKIQPLCGIYRSACRGIVEQLLAEGRLRMMDLLRHLQAQTVRVEEVLLNLNTPEDYHGILNAHGRI